MCFITMGNGCKHSVLYITTLSDQFLQQIWIYLFHQSITYLCKYGNRSWNLFRHLHRKNIIFLWETLSVEKGLFHLHLFCAIFASIKKAGIAQTAVKNKIIPPTRIFQRDAVTKSTFTSPCHCIIIALEVSENCHNWQISRVTSTYQSYCSPTFQTFSAVVKNWHLSQLNKSCEAVSL